MHVPESYAAYKSYKEAKGKLDIIKTDEEVFLAEIDEQLGLLLEMGDIFRYGIAYDLAMDYYYKNKEIAIINKNKCEFCEKILGEDDFDKETIRICYQCMPKVSGG